MPRERIYPNTIEEAVEAIIPFLEDKSKNAQKAIYFDGWLGLAASAVLRAIANDPPPSLRRKFNKIIHVDCSRWKSRRELQRTIVQQLKLPHWVMDVLDRQDEEDDFTGVDEGSRVEIRDVGEEIYEAMREHRCLVVFNNGSEDTIDLNDFGIPLDQWSQFGSKVLWTFRGRLRLNSKISEKVDNSHVYLYDEYSSHGWDFLLRHEARDIAGYITDKPAIEVEKCCSYLLSLNSEGGNTMDFNWATHASNYWVCDCIIEGGQADKAWEVAAALHQHIQMEDYSSNVLPTFGVQLKADRWILARDNSVVHPESTSFFLAAITNISNPPSRPLPNDMFHQSNKLRVLKLCGCTFSFHSPPFRCCHRLRFLGLDGCKDQQEDGKQDRTSMLFFQSLWVLDICNTDWILDLSPEIVEQMSANIREVHIKKRRFWHMKFSWRKLQNLRKLRIIEPTCPWEMGEKDELTNMVKMEFLDISGNYTILVLPSLSMATSLKTLVLDGCLGLEYVEGIPLSLESFSLDVGPRKYDNNEAKISRISMAGCSRLYEFKLRGSLPNLEKLDLSGTKLKTLDLRGHVVEVPCLQQVILLGCEQLRAVLWPEEGMPQLSLLCIDNRGGEEVRRIPQGYTKLIEGYCQAYVAMMDMRFIQSLMLTSLEDFCWNNSRFGVHICISASSTDGERSCKKEKMSPSTSGKIFGPTLPMSLISNPSYNTYIDVTIDDMTIHHDYNSASQFQPSGCHVEIGEGISNTRVGSLQGMEAIIFVINKTESLHVHDNSFITTVIPENMTQVEELTCRYLKQCHVVRCPKIHTVFISNYRVFCFHELESFWAADLQMVHCIWSKGSMLIGEDTKTFRKLQSVHLYSCPRLSFVLPLSWNAPNSYFPNLETLHIVNCGDLIKVFPVEEVFMARISTDHRKGILEFPNLKHIYLHELNKLQKICEAKIFAPKLETVRLRGCWGLRRLPSVGRNNRRRPTVDCERDWWEKLEWDGLVAGHDPSLFEPRHSSYYKKPLPRVSVLR